MILKTSHSARSYRPQPVDRENPQPLNGQVHDEICQAISKGLFAQGTVLPKREELARAFGVGVNTVRLALERLTAEKVVVSRPRVGCMIINDAPTFFCGKILYVLTEFSGAYAAGMFRAAMENEFMQSGYHLFAVNVDWRRNRPLAQQVLKAALAERPDFVIFNTCPMGEHEALKMIARSGLPYVTLNSSAKRRGKALAVFENDFSTAIADFASSCKKCRIRSVAQFDFGKHSFVDISKPFERIGINVEKVSVALDEVFSNLELIQDSSAAAMRRRLARGLLPDLLFFSDDYLARGALPVLLEQGVRVPFDVRVATLSNRGFPPAFPSPLATIEFDPAIAGRTLARRILGYFQTRRLATEPVCIYSFVSRGMLH